ncbi:MULTISPECIES: enoyl-CoA hydratase/isomerase family protein [Sphingomonas]|jgi:2-(1,2-epoxy-1,2-dihydrophenyl)acetyl-CoA isomerase|nr:MULTISPECIES: enoyl-CoA hydratase/isomerase family protein [Sphingomonas]MBB4049671.1 2-(1,2-epoxy-1,2-dihydrophenyl)acetyl-CoA isomerase [Sphingomonas zeae]MDK8217337.1 enoyl-CoA hydratase/isomerase family protein [Sphingomonas sp. UMB7805-LC452B]
MNESESPVIHLSMDGPIARLTLARPAAGNALGARTGKALREAFETVEQNDSLRCLLLVSQGRAFCVGGDLAEFAQLSPLAPAIDALVDDFHGACAAMARLSIPVVTLVQGAAAGAGLALVGLSDIAIASRGATFAYAYPKVGFSSDGGLTWLLPRLIGVRAFQTFSLLGQSWDAAAALSAGLVSEVVDADDLSARGEAIALELARGPTRAFGEIRRLMLTGLGRGYSEHLAEEQDAMVRLADTEDARTAIPAFLVRQAPAYVGR